MNAHTPGPWRVLPTKHVVGFAVWSGTPNGSDEYRVCGVGLTPTIGEAKANAVLISAAPDLLDALDTLLNRIELEGCTPLDWPSFRAGRAAIKKATGATA